DDDLVTAAPLLLHIDDRTPPADNGARYRLRVRVPLYARHCLIGAVDLAVLQRSLARRLYRGRGRSYGDGRSGTYETSGFLRRYSWRCAIHAQCGVVQRFAECF